MPKVSVIVPNYNHARYLPKRIESILNQTYQDFELIILDDCSTDDSFRIISQYHKHPRISQVIVNQVNSGSVFKQWQKGLSAASGEYVWIAESDDYAHEKLMEVLVNQLEANSQVAIAYCNSFLINGKGELQESPDYFSKAFVCAGTSFVEKNMTVWNSIYNASAVLFRRNAALKANLSYQYFKYCGDWLFWVSLLTQNKIAYVPEKLNYFRRHPDSASHRPEQRNIALIEGFQILSFIRKSFAIHPNRLKEIMGAWSEQWLANFKTSKHYHSIKQQLILYKAASQFDARMVYFLMKAFIKQTFFNQQQEHK